MATTPEKIDFTKISIFHWIESFLVDYESNIGAAESDLQNISRDHETLKSKITNNPQMIESIDKLHALTEKELEIEGSFNRARRYFESGVLMFVHQSLRTMLKTYGNILTQSNYSETNILDMLDEIHALELSISNHTITLQADVDAVISFLRKEGAELTGKTGLFTEFSMFDLEDTAKDIKELQTNFNDFLSYFKNRIIQAAIFSFHMRCKEKETDEALLKEIKERLIKILGQDKLDAAFKGREENFDLVAAARKSIDALHPNVRRIKYIYQAYDKACFFNPGYCEGGVRIWAESMDITTLDRTPDQRKTRFLTYRDAHDFEVTARIAHLQINQQSSNQLNESGNHIIFYTTLKSFDQPFFKMSEEEQAKLKLGKPAISTLDRTAVQRFTDLVLDELHKTLEAYQASNQPSPVINIIFCAKEKSGAHAFGIKPFNAGEDVLFRVMDLNDGEFEIDSLQDFRKWLPEFFIDLNYHTLFDSYRLQILQPKPKNSLLSATSLEHMIRNRAEARETFQTAYVHHKDNLQRKEIAKLYSKRQKNEIDAVKHIKQELECYRKILDKTVFDHQVALQSNFHLTFEFDDNHPEEALMYNEKSISLTKYLFSIKGPKGKAKMKSKYLAFEGLLNIYKATLQEKIKPGSSLEAMKKGCTLLKSPKFKITPENEKEFKLFFETIEGIQNLAEQGKHKEAYVLTNKLTEAMTADVLRKQIVLPLLFRLPSKLMQLNVLEISTEDSDKSLLETGRAPDSERALLEIAAAYEEAHANHEPQESPENNVQREVPQIDAMTGPTITINPTIITNGDPTIITNRDPISNPVPTLLNLGPFFIPEEQPGVIKISAMPSLPPINISNSDLPSLSNGISNLNIAQNAFLQGLSGIGHATINLGGIISPAIFMTSGSPLAVNITAKINYPTSFFIISKNSVVRDGAESNPGIEDRKAAAEALATSPNEVDNRLLPYYLKLHIDKNCGIKPNFSPKYLSDKHNVNVKDFNPEHPLAELFKEIYRNKYASIHEAATKQSKSLSTSLFLLGEKQLDYELTSEDDIIYIKSDAPVFIISAPIKVKGKLFIQCKGIVVLNASLSAAECYIACSEFLSEAGADINCFNDQFAIFTANAFENTEKQRLELTNLLENFYVANNGDKNFAADSFREFRETELYVRMLSFIQPLLTKIDQALQSIVISRTGIDELYVGLDYFSLDAFAPTFEYLGLCEPKLQAQTKLALPQFNLTKIISSSDPNNIQSDTDDLSTTLGRSKIRV